MFLRAALHGILTLLLIASSVTVSAKTVELPVYRDWRGDNCQFESERPFFLIRDIHDLEMFWQKANAGEPQPWVDFEKYMLFVWCPGPTLFDYRPVEVERLLSKDGSYIVQMNFKRKDTGGFWRRPFVATMLPLISRGDIFVMRKIEHGPENIEWKPLYNLWDMSGDRTRPFEMVQLDPKVQPQQFVSHGPEKPENKTVVAKAEPQPVKTTTEAQMTQPEKTEPVSQPARPAAAATPANSLPDDDIFGTGSGKTTPPVNKPEIKAEPAKVDPAFEEDPLFGTEFDITF